MKIRLGIEFELTLREMGSRKSGEFDVMLIKPKALDDNIS